jgi:hypothetical protein
MTNPIETAVAPLKVDAAKRAIREATEFVAKFSDKLSAVDGDVLALNPYPKNASRSEYKQYEAFGNTINALTVPDPNRPYKGWRGSPYYKVIDQDRVARFIENAKDLAEAQYDAFVGKLCAKIGKVSVAELSGNHVWSYSILEVVKADGTTEAWKTQQIVNCSVLGTLFNQWPTRKVKVNIKVGA